MLRAVRKQHFPDSPRAAALWVKVFSFAVARARSDQLARAGGDGLEMVAEALKNSTARNAEETYHARRTHTATRPPPPLPRPPSRTPRRAAGATRPAAPAS